MVGLWPWVNHISMRQSRKHRDLVHSGGLKSDMGFNSTITPSTVTSRIRSKKLLEKGT